MKLRVKTIDGHFVGVYEFEEARTWDYDEPEARLVIDNRHVTSWDELVAIATSEANRACEEVVIYQVSVVAGG